MVKKHTRSRRLAEHCGHELGIPTKDLIREELDGAQEELAAAGVMADADRILFDNIVATVECLAFGRDPTRADAESACGPSTHLVEAVWRRLQHEH